MLCLKYDELEYENVLEQDVADEGHSTDIDWEAQPDDQFEVSIVADETSVLSDQNNIFDHREERLNQTDEVGWVAELVSVADRVEDLYHERTECVD